VFCVLLASLFSISSILLHFFAELFLPTLFAMPRHFSVHEKELVVNAREYFRAEKSAGASKDVSQVVKRTADCLQISVSSVKKICNESEENGCVLPPVPRLNQGHRIVLDEFFQGVVRRTVHSFYIEKDYPTVEKVLQKVRENCGGDFPDICLSTFRKIMRKLGFHYRPFNKKSIFMESPQVVNDRCVFLRAVRGLRRSGWNIFYTDETWCGANHARSTGWLEKVSQESSVGYDRDRGCIQQVNGWKGGIRVPSGAGKRLIICHIGSEQGFVQGEGIELCFIGQKGSADYHQEMNAQHYKEWFANALTKLPDQSAIVIDQAKYHTMLTEETKAPNMSWNKAPLVEWAYHHNVRMPEFVSYPEELTKEELLIASKPYFVPKVKVLQDLVDKCGKQIRLLWLPVAHCELNAIELIWANVKGHVARYNTEFKIHSVQSLVKEGLQRVTPEVWKKAVDHVRKIEERYAATLNLMDIPIEPVRFQINDSDSSDSDSDCEGYESG
jgi:hypothetical protein